MLSWLLTTLTAAASGAKGRGRYHAEAETDGAFDPEANVCLLTIMTQERRASLHRMLAAWDGYISIALLVDDYPAAVAQGMHVLAYQGRAVPAPLLGAVAQLHNFFFQKMIICSIKML